MTDHPLNVPFMHEGQELVPVKENHEGCEGCVFLDINCAYIVCGGAARVDRTPVIFVPIKEFYIRRLKGLT